MPEELLCHLGSGLFEHTDTAGFKYYGAKRAMDVFLESWTEARGRRVAETKVFRLYTIVLRDFEKLPDEKNPEWMDFSFYLYPTPVRKQRMAEKYVQLADKAYLTDVATAWENHSLEKLFQDKGIEVTDFTANDIHFGRSPLDRLEVYRLMMEIHHLHSGLFYKCAGVHIHGDFERAMKNRFHVEADNFCFYKTNSWEKWQLSLLFKELFERKDFDPREMQAVSRSDSGEGFHKWMEDKIYTRRFSQQILS
ncbi:uncharacterized protein K452DRAFT_308660 [Aplosporella prunicola CBS 121167]|uniref:Uncharacterized protein n=1 Tax=Aplosporella prunicola CBS 121167 TaxID=1176127 RepID=A0A6A6BD88_9PEZI|nr:uncharacterized protein K452DRAFT_308660 [Aplosporella prunicola CBS 121167]KAF2141558.1 hypothetical protein K452DRAFT_308660 [Aplosporella prunicola CBS 121167]